MTDQLTTINWPAVLLAFVAYFMLGYAWYAILFKRLYKISLGKENETLPAKPVFIIGPAVCCIAYTITTAVLMHALHIDSYAQALEFAFIAGTGYLVANTVNIAINPNIPRQFLYGAISGSYFLTGLIVVSIILVAMK